MKRSHARSSSRRTAAVRAADTDVLDDSAWMAARALTCGPRTRAFIASLFGVPPMMLRSVTWHATVFNINVIDTRSSSFSIRIRWCWSASEAEAPGNVPAGEFLIIGNTGSDTPLQQALVQNAARSFRDLPAGQLFSLIRKDPETRVTRCDGPKVRKAGPVQDRGTPRPEGVSSVAYTEFPYYEWGNPHAQDLFVFNSMLRALNPFSGIRTEGLRQLDHADRECVYMADRPDRAHHLGVVDARGLQERSSETDTREQKHISREEQQRSKDLPSMVSILNDEDIIAGTTERLKTMLHAMVDVGISRDVLINCTCTPLIIGDDVRSVVANVNQQRAAHFFYCDPVKQAASDIYRSHLEHMLSRLTPHTATSCSVTMIGFPDVPAIRELKVFMRTLGITITSELLPVIPEDMPRDYLKGSVQVFFLNDDLSSLYELFHTIDRPRVISEAPYGLAKTTAWFEALARELGIELKSNAQWQQHLTAVRDQLQPALWEAKKYTLGIVISPMDMPFILDAHKNILSVPLIAMIEEFGFQWDILLYCPADQAAENTEKIRGLFSAPDRHRICQGFDHSAVKKWLSTTRASCIYSDLFFDQRLTRAGKTRFSLFDLEMGYAGMMRTVERLLKKCRTQFYATYRGYFHDRPEPVTIEER